MTVRGAALTLLQDAFSGRYAPEHASSRTSGRDVLGVGSIPVTSSLAVARQEDD